MTRARGAPDGVAAADMTVEVADVNGVTGVVISGGGKVLTAMAAGIADGKVQALHLVANPDKLRSVSERRLVSLVR